MIRTKGLLTHVYITKEKPACMIAHANVHSALELQRMNSSNNQAGPRVLLVGAADSGKTTLAQVLLNYAARSGWTPHFVDLDVSQNSIVLPGSIGAVQVHQPLALQGCPWHFSPRISYFYGHTAPTTSPEIYKKSINGLAAALQARIGTNEKANRSGIIVNTCGLPADSFSHDMVLHISEQFAINILFVIGSDRLEAGFLEEKKLNHVKIIRVPKSGGVRAASAHPIFTIIHCFFLFRAGCGTGSVFSAKITSIGYSSCILLCVCVCVCVCLPCGVFFSLVFHTVFLRLSRGVSPTCARSPF